MLSELFQTFLRKPAHLEDMGLSWRGCAGDVPAQQHLTTTVIESALLLAANRTFSMLLYEVVYIQHDVLNTNPKQDKATVIKQQNEIKPTIA